MHGCLITLKTSHLLIVHCDLYFLLAPALQALVLVPEVTSRLEAFSAKLQQELAAGKEQERKVGGCCWVCCSSCSAHGSK